MNCGQRGLLEMPKSLPPSVKCLYLYHNSIKTVHAYFFTNLKNLEKMDLSHNKIETIDNSTFRYLLALTVLKLNNNNLSMAYEDFPDDMFWKLKRLEVLEIQENIIK